ncbi:MAG: alpha/beta hydrolase [Tepidisphaerales bacterium]
MQIRLVPIVAACLLLAAEAASAADLSPQASQDAVAALQTYLAAESDSRPAIDKQPFAATPLTKADAETAQQLLWDDHVKQIRRTRAEEMKDRRLREGKLEMPFFYEVFGDKPKTGRSLFISMHGGGNAPKQLNDQQWENQKHLYRPAEGVYLAPRAPTNTWNLWHEPHIDRMFARLIEDLVVFEDVDPNRVYIMGYSAGGDGVYQLAPRMADRLAAASMMAGHPNDASPLGLRNIAFAIHVGALDGGYGRNKVAAEWGKKLDDLQKADPDGYVHLVKLHEGKSHWMDREDAEAVPWMAKFTRNPLPSRVVWKQGGTTHARFYWLAVGADDQKAGAEVTASFAGQQITIETKDVHRLLIRFDDRMMDLDKPIKVTAGERELFSGPAKRSIGMLARTLAEYGDPAAVSSAEVEIGLDVP